MDDRRWYCGRGTESLLEGDGDGEWLIDSDNRSTTVTCGRGMCDPSSARLVVRRSGLGSSLLLRFKSREISTFHPAGGVQRRDGALERWLRGRQQWWRGYGSGAAQGMGSAGKQWG
jgi:hypothetical protein